MAFGSLVQSKSGTVPYTAAQTYISLTFDSAPTEGNLLVAFHYSGNGVVTQPTGWNVAFWLTQPVDDDEGGIFYKIAGASESSTVMVTCAAANEHVMTIAEFEGPFAGQVFDVESHSAYTVTSSPLSTGTTAATSQADELLLYFGAGRDEGAEPVGGGATWSGSPTEIDMLESTNKWIHSAYKVLSAAGTQSSTWTSVNYYSTGHHVGIAAFRKQGTSVTNYYFPLDETAYINVASNANITDLHTASFTVEAWVYADDIGHLNAGTIFAKGNWKSSGWMLSYNSSASNFTFLVEHSLTDGQIIGTFTPDSSWHHVAATFQKSNNQPSMYIDGVLTGTRTYAVGTPSSDTGVAMRIGAPGNSTANRLWDGGVGGWFRLSDSIRYSSNFTPDPYCAPPAVDGNTLIQFNFTDGSGSNVSDISGNDYDGTVYNSSWTILCGSAASIVPQIMNYYRRLRS